MAVRRGEDTRKEDVVVWSRPRGGERETVLPCTHTQRLVSMLDFMTVDLPFFVGTCFMHSN